MLGVEGVPDRDVIVVFTKHVLSYNPGEDAAFYADEAQALIDQGVAAAPGPPTNVDAPHVSQSGDILTCTMGNWYGTPTSYAYQWRLDGTVAGTNSPTYDAAVGDIGSTATCTVTATNASGSTAAPPSNAHVIVAGA